MSTDLLLAIMKRHSPSMQTQPIRERCIFPMSTVRAPAREELGAAKANRLRRQALKMQRELLTASPLEKH
jgi:hypothetical protein